MLSSCSSCPGPRIALYMSKLDQTATPAMTGRVDSDMTDKDATTRPTGPAASSGRGACVTYRTHITTAKTHTTSPSRNTTRLLGSPDGVDPKKTPTAVFRIKYPNMPT